MLGRLWVEGGPRLCLRRMSEEVSEEGLLAMFMGFECAALLRVWNI